MARNQFRRQNQSSRPNRSWAGAIPATFVTVPPASKILLATLTLSNQGIDETILRTIGQVTVMSDQSASLEDQMGAIGFCLAIDTAVGVGIGSLPDSVTDVGDDIWFMYQGFAQEMDVGSAIGFDSFKGHTYTVDSRAKRIMHSGMTGALIAANAHASFGFNIAFLNRVLTQVRGTR